jgi:hypothetical protein
MAMCQSNNFMLPKRRFWKDEQMMISGFSTDFSMVRSPSRVLTPLKSASHIRIYAPQTKILEGGTRDEMRMFDALFNG